MGNNNGNNHGSTQGLYEKASQEMCRYGWLIFYAIVALLAGAALVFAGIYYSQIAMARVMGDTGVNRIITWSVAIFVSAAEVFGLSLFFSGTSISNVIKEASTGEHAIGFWGTIGCFLYDFVTNVVGMYVTCLALVGSVTWQWLIIIPLSLLFSFAEVFVGLAFRALGLNFARFVPAKAKVEVLRERMEQDATREAKSIVGNASQNNRPGMEKDFDRFVENSGQEYRPSLQPALQRSQYRGNNGRNQPRG